MKQEIERVISEINSFQPDVVLCASKGGAYMVELWRLMEVGYLPKRFGCLMINVHPKVKRLPEGVKVIIVQGAKEEIWPKPRGYNNFGRVEPDSLEALIRTGSPGTTYFALEQPIFCTFYTRSTVLYVPVSASFYCRRSLLPVLHSRPGRCSETRGRYARRGFDARTPVPSTPD